MQPIVVEQFFDVSSKTLWDVLTRHRHMVQWFFDNIPDFKAEEGFKTQFLIKIEDRCFTHLWEIVAVVPEKKIVYDWRYGEYPGVGKIEFDLSSVRGQTKLTLTNWGLETFPKDVPEFSMENCIGGWTYFIKENLPLYVANLA